MEKHKSPTLKNLTSDTFGRPPDSLNPVLQALGAPHVESFNFMIKEGFKLAVKNLDAVEFQLPNGDKVGFKFQSVVLYHPQVHNSLVSIKSTTILPSECRQRGETYKGVLLGKLAWWINGQQKETLTISLGQVPVMVKSSVCHLAGMTPTQLVAAGEEEDCWGGYFISRGHERLVRMLVQTRANFPLALQRTSYKGRGNQFSDQAVYIRCVREDLAATTNVLHFVSDGTAKLMFSFEKHMYFVPLVLAIKALLDVTDQYIFQQLLVGCHDDLYYRSCCVTMLRLLHEESIHSHNEARSFLGKSFKVKFRNLAPWLSDLEVCDFLLKKCVLPHLTSPEDKIQLLCFMSRKLFAGAQKKCKPENMDAVMMQEVLLGGHLYLKYLAERLERWTNNLKYAINKKASPTFKLSEAEMQLAIKRSGTLEAAMENFLATGNINSTSGLGLMQEKGLTIVAENINRMRYMSHFRAVHRGSYFQEMRTTESRQLLPDAWGFICPVHTPDGAPCGLLNHLTRHCRVVTQVCDVSALPSLLGALGMSPVGEEVKQVYWVLLDGRVLGHVSQQRAPGLVEQLRLLKTQPDDTRVPAELEVVLVPQDSGQFPGLFLFSGMSRLVRPVLQLTSQRVELIGTFEQVYLNIAITPSEITPGVTTHLEISETTFLSSLACLIPMPDCNQSPRNMYQCQMGKQSMGNPVHSWHLQSETKLYRLQTPASPLFRPAQYDAVALDNNAMGVNAVVAVISYTGYDMEDAMIINKSSYERGLAHGSIYKSEFVDLEPSSYFCRDPENLELNRTLDKDGLPYIGSVLREEDPMHCSFDYEQSRYRVRKYMGKEKVYVESVKMCGQPVTSTKPQAHRASITLRVPRNPTVGDKFASRAGQKGICSQRWPAEDLPFTESGMVPDIVFNPHGFPSRMTIAMMVELMAGKSGALHGLVHDATPFRFSEEDTAIDYFGKLLQDGGYNYQGTERMYSGVDGREMKADIFFGVVYYQRLRHMVSDKWQVRSTGPVDTVTRQPLKGRRRGGGVRFGEMERDSLISHGASFLLQDRLLNCSDKSAALVCRECGSLLSTCESPLRHLHGKPEGGAHCLKCGDKACVEEVELPHILRYLVAQLAAVNISTRLELSSSSNK